MDRVLSGVLASNNPEVVKKAMFERISKAANNPHYPDVVTRVLEISASMTLDGNSKLETDGGIMIFKHWAKYNPSTFQLFFTPFYIHQLMDGQMANKRGAIVIMRECITLLDGEKKDKLMCIIEAKAIGFLRSYPDMSTLLEFVKFLGDFPQCIPKGDFRSTFCSAYIGALHEIPMPGNCDEIPLYMSTVENLAKFLNTVWESSQPDALLSSLRTILNLIATPGDENNTTISMSLAPVIQLLPVSMIGDATKAVLNDPSLTDDNIKVAVSCLVHWMSWVTASNISQWVLAFLKGLAALGHYQIVIAIILSNIEKVYEKIAIPVVREKAMLVLYYMLMSFQHSPDAFHKIANRIPATVAGLKKENTPFSEECLKKLAELSYCQMHHHSGFPDLYDPILEAFKEYTSPSAEVIQGMLAETKWRDEQLDVIFSPSSTAVSQKSETGKVGLENLGNTCYMNSVLQALYMCDDFRQGVFARPNHPQTKVLLKLQHCFAHLRLSQRPAYYPSALLSASRPPWFTQGHQQDCSEYLRHLLVHIDEQEQALGPKRDDDKMETDQKEPTLIERLFTGKLMMTHGCLKCGEKSSRTEDFIDLSLPFAQSKEPVSNGTSEEHSASSDANGASDEKSAEKMVKPKDSTKNGISLSDMICSFLAPEKLHGDNCYHCDNCDSLEDAERTISITQAPTYLVLSLLRFSYDVKSQSRSKILRDVRYPEVFYLPVTSQDTGCNGTDEQKPATVVSHEMYCLNAVIIHAGLSSDCGHYYTYARNLSQGDINRIISNADCDDMGDAKNASKPEKWYLFNDSRVSFSSYSSFSCVTKRFSRDTAYVLLYKRVTSPDQVERSQLEDKTQPPLRKDLRDAVEKDNRSFFEEQERSARLKSKRKHNIDCGASPTLFRYPDDDKGGPPGSCGGEGFGGLNNGTRFVF